MDVALVHHPQELVRHITAPDRFRDISGSNVIKSSVLHTEEIDSWTPDSAALRDVMSCAGLALAR